MRLTFLGTGAAGGTPGRGRSQRRESSLLVEGHANVLIDAPAHVADRLGDFATLDAVLLTHAHRDAAGGIRTLGRRRAEHRLPPLRVYSSPQALDVLRAGRWRSEQLTAIPVEPVERRRLAGLELRAVEVPHAREPRYRTYAWRLSNDARALVYASDVGRLEPALKRLARGTDLLIIDGAMWRRSLFSHLRIDRDLPVVCRWRVARILITQIGRSAPPHELLEQAVAELCPKAVPAWDGLTVELAGRQRHSRCDR
jgi:ribonuclease BN (tRNA processing enzyme)